MKMTLTVEESKHINDVPPPKVIIAGAGMSNAGRILHHDAATFPILTALCWWSAIKRGFAWASMVDGAKKR